MYKRLIRGLAACIGLAGWANVSASNGATGTYHFKRLSMDKGYGAGRYSERSMSFTYGLTADESKPYLKLRPGQKLEESGETLELVETAPARRRSLAAK